MIRAAPVVLLLLAACSAPGDAPRNDIAFANQSIVLPDEPETPALPEIVQTHCTACHSADMIANQPPLRPETWAAEVKKMREVYKAETAPADDAAIITALSAMQARSALAENGAAGED